MPRRLFFMFCCLVGEFSGFFNLIGRYLYTVAPFVKIRGECVYFPVVFKSYGIFPAQLFRDVVFVFLFFQLYALGFETLRSVSRIASIRACKVGKTLIFERLQGVIFSRFGIIPEFLYLRRLVRVF